MRVSREILALGCDFQPYPRIRQVKRHRPSGLTPVHLAACLSTDASVEMENSQAWCPHVLAAKQDPEKSFLPDRQIREILIVLSIQEELDLILPLKRPAGLYLPAVKEMPRSLADLAPLYFSPKVLRTSNLIMLVTFSDEETTAPLSDNICRSF